MSGIISIDIGQGYRTKVYLDTFTKHKLDSFKWSAQVHKRGKVYAQGGKEGWTITIHRLITGAKQGEQVDHIDGDGLNNLDDNLRIATRQQNRANSRKSRTNTSGFKGVSWSKSSKKWMAQIVVDGKRHYLGVFEHKERAAKAHDRAALHHHGEFAGLNFEHLRDRYNDCDPERH